MKKLIAFTALLSIPTSAFAEPVRITRVLKDTTTQVALLLDSKSVFCTERGYGTTVLKVSVPDLDWLAHFDHRVVGETLPCINGGECTAALEPGKLIDPQEPFAIVPMRVVLKETLTLNAETRSCARQLAEEIRSNIRGHDFTHFRGSEREASVPYEACRRIAGL